MTINIKIKADKVTICQENEHQGFLKVLGMLADHLEAIAQGKPFQIKENYNMALSTAEQAIVDRLDTATSAVATVIRDLRDNPPADDAEFNAKLTEIADGLDALAKPGTPLPGPGPQPTP